VRFMTREETDFLDRFETILEDGLHKICAGEGLLGSGVAVVSPDIEEAWDRYIKEYIADAVVNFNSYPEATISWAGFLGMGVAHNWDKDWKKHCSDSYPSYYGSRGWDDMDEHILYEVLGFQKGDKKAEKISQTLLSCALASLSLMRHEGIETETEMGFYVLSRSYTVLFRLGAAIEEKRLGYKAVAVKR